MRICFVMPQAQGKITGGFVYNSRLIEYLREGGHEVEIVSLPWRSLAQDLPRNLSPSLLRTLSKPVDIMLQDKGNYASLFYLNRRLKGCSKVAIVHHLNWREQHNGWRNRLLRAVEKRYLASVDAHIFASEDTRQDVTALVGTGRPSVTAYPGGDRFSSRLSEAEIRERAARSGPLRLLFVGSLIPRKGVEHLVEALSRLPEDAARLEIAGGLDHDHAYTLMIEQLIKQRGLSERIAILGRIDDEDLRRRYEQSDTLVVPSSFEGYGIVYAEGMAFGLPAIASAEGARAIIEDGVNGFMVAPGDIDGLSAAISRLSRDRGLLARMSLAARERSAELTGWDETMAKIHEFLRSLA